MCEVLPFSMLFKYLFFPGCGGLSHLPVHRYDLLLAWPGGQDLRSLRTVLSFCSLQLSSAYFLGIIPSRVRGS